MKKNSKITRTEALKKMGKYSALTAITTFNILTPLHASSGSSPNEGARTSRNDIWKD